MLSYLSTLYLHHYTTRTVERELFRGFTEILPEVITITGCFDSFLLNPGVFLR